MNDPLLTIAGLVNTYHNDGTTLSAAETLRAIADVLGPPMEAETERPVRTRLLELLDGVAWHLRPSVTATGFPAPDLELARTYLIGAIEHVEDLLTAAVGRRHER